MPYIFDDGNAGTKTVEEEKLVTYLADLELKTNMRDDDLAKAYTHALMFLMNKVVKKDSNEAVADIKQQVATLDPEIAELICQRIDKGTVQAQARS